MIDLIWDKGSVNQISYRGNGTEWVQLKKNYLRVHAATTNNSDKDPYSNLPHLIYEFAISRDFFKNKTEIGFSVYANNKGIRDLKKCYILLPSTANNLIPITWANLALITSYENDASNLNSSAAFSSTSPPSRMTKTLDHALIPLNSPEPKLVISSENISKTKLLDNQILLYISLLMVIILVVVIPMILFFKSKKNKQFQIKQKSML